MQVFAARPHQKTLIFISSEGGSYGGLGLAHFLETDPLGADVKVVLSIQGLGREQRPDLLGGVTGPRETTPGWYVALAADTLHQAGLGLQLPPLPDQIATQSLKVAQGEQVAGLRAGIPSLLLYDQGEDIVTTTGLGTQGAAVERLILSLDAGGDIPDCTADGAGAVLGSLPDRPRAQHPERAAAPADGHHGRGVADRDSPAPRRMAALPAQPRLVRAAPRAGRPARATVRARRPAAPLPVPGHHGARDPRDHTRAARHGAAAGARPRRVLRSAATSWATSSRASRSIMAEMGKLSLGLLVLLAGLALLASHAPFSLLIGVTAAWIWPLATCFAEPRPVTAPWWPRARSNRRLLLLGLIAPVLLYAYLALEVGMGWWSGWWFLLVQTVSGAYGVRGPAAGVLITSGFLILAGCGGCTCCPSRHSTGETS